MLTCYTCTSTNGECCVSSIWKCTRHIWERKICYALMHPHYFNSSTHTKHGGGVIQFRFRCHRKDRARAEWWQNARRVIQSLFCTACIFSANELLHRIGWKLNLLNFPAGASYHRIAIYFCLPFCYNAPLVCSVQYFPDFSHLCFCVRESRHPFAPIFFAVNTQNYWQGGEWVKQLQWKLALPIILAPYSYSSVLRIVSFAVCIVRCAVDSVQ